MGPTEERKEARLIHVRIAVAGAIQSAVEIAPLVDGCVVPEDPGRRREVIGEVIEELHLVRGVVRLVVHVELTVLEKARRVVVVRRALINQTVTAKEVFDLKIVGSRPAEGQLRSRLPELFLIKTIGRCAKIAPVNVPREDAIVVARSIGSTGVVKASQRGGGVTEAVSVNVVNACPVVLRLDYIARGLIGEGQDRPGLIVEVAQQRVRRLRDVNGAIARNQVGRVPLTNTAFV